MKWTALRIIPPLDRSPAVVRFAQTPLGKVVVLAFYAAGLLALERFFWIDMMVILAAMTFFPQWRRGMLLLGTTYWLFTYTLFDWHKLAKVIHDLGLESTMDWVALKPTLIAAVILYCACFYTAAVRWQDTWLFRRPLVTMFTVYFVLVFCALHVPLEPTARVYLWGFIIVFGRYVWFLAYSLTDRRSANDDGLPWQFRSYLPFWIGVTTSPAPIAKGAAYLRRIEAKTPEELAISQLKGVKLLYWAGVLVVFETIVNNVLHGAPGYLEEYFHIPYSLGLPVFRDAMNAAIAGNPLPWYSNWLSLLAQLLKNVLYIAIWGHVIVSGARMAGFNALRGTYKPLAAKTLTEFWNRYFYYFKELLVEFFFYPVYLRYFKKQPRIRLFVATLAAAGFGNVLFHYIRDIEYIIDMGLWQALLAFHVYIFYGMVLGAGIAISQWRQRQNKPKRHWFREEILSRLGVVIFFCFVLIFDDPVRTLTLKDNFVFVLSLFGIG